MMNYLHLFIINKIVHSVKEKLWKKVPFKNVKLFHIKPTVKFCGLSLIDYTKIYIFILIFKYLNVDLQFKEKLDDIFIYLSLLKLKEKQLYIK